MSNRPSTPLLDKVRYPADLRKLNEEELPQLADELRAEMIDAVSVTGGHLGAGLGVVELTVAIHYIFNTPDDRLIWDVGHQCYPHKIITGRRDRIRTLRKENGLSGFTKRDESEYDPFGAAHSSTSISAGLGMAVARELKGGDNNVIAVIGDGAMSAGMAFEAMNNAGAMDARLIVILNDNDMSIAPPTGAMSAYLARLASGRTYMGMRELGKKLTAYLGKTIDRAITRAVEHARGYVTGGTLFEELGFHGSRTNYYHRSNSYLNEVLDDREGLPITLAVLYQSLGKRIGLNIEGVGLPGHFVARFVPEEGEPQLVDPFERGKLLSRNDAELIVLAYSGHPLEESNLTAQTTPEILSRMLRNLLSIAQEKQDEERMLRYMHVLITLNPESVHDRWTRALLAYRSDQLELALADLDWLDEQSPPSFNPRAVSQLRQAIHQKQSRLKKITDSDIEKMM